MRRLLQGMRDAWLIFGITLLLFVLLGMLYRAQGDARRWLASRATVVNPTQHPYAHETWFPAYKEIKGRSHAFDPYRGYWPGPFRSAYINVDSAGRRVTIQPTHDPATVRRVFLLGGSAMWGFNARDSFTIASQTAARLHARGLDNVELVNLAQPGYNTTQEATTLLVELGRGHIPDAVVALDGYNDIRTALEAGEPGHIYNEPAIAQRLKRGGYGLWRTLASLGRFSALVERLHASTAPPSPAAGKTLPPDRICGPVAAYYRNMVRSMEGMAQEYGFPIFFLFQPLAATTGKPLTAWERSLGEGATFQRCAAAVDSAMSDQADRQYFSLSGLYDRDTTSVFLDDMAHVTETASGRIADRIVDVVAPALGAQPRP